MDKREFSLEQARLRTEHDYPTPSNREKRDLADWLAAHHATARPSATPSVPLVSRVHTHLTDQGFTWTEDPLGLLVGSVSIGGYGWAPTPGASVMLVIDAADALYVLDANLVTQPIRLKWGDLHSIQFGGPGAVTTGGGFIGGGFGIEGAAIGMIAAEVLNALTTRTTILSTIFISGHTGEAILANDQHTPEELRIRLSPVVGRVAAAQRHEKPAAGTDPLDRLEKLHQLHQAGALTEAEYEAARARIVKELTGE